MKNSKIIAAFAFAAVLGIFPGIAHAQAEAAAAALAEPIISKVVSVITPNKDPKGTWLKAEVIHADAQSMMVREQTNGKMIHTFTYGADIKEGMQNLQYQGGYQYGDKVKILYQPGKTEALRIHGKPSKSQ